MNFFGSQGLRARELREVSRMERDESNVVEFPMLTRIEQRCKPPLMGEQLEQYLTLLGEQTSKATAAQSCYQRAEHSEGAVQRLLEERGHALVAEVRALGARLREIESQRKWL